MRAVDFFDPHNVAFFLFHTLLVSGGSSQPQPITAAQGVRIGMVVNDMAEVNVDAKLVRDDPGSQGTGVDSVELQNGCICW